MKQQTVPEKLRFRPVPIPKRSFSNEPRNKRFSPHASQRTRAYSQAAFLGRAKRTLAGSLSRKNGWRDTNSAWGQPGRQGEAPGHPSRAQGFDNPSKEPIWIFAPLPCSNGVSPAERARPALHGAGRGDCALADGASRVFAWCHRLGEAVRQIRTNLTFGKSPGLALVTRRIQPTRLSLESTLSPHASPGSDPETLVF